MGTAVLMSGQLREIVRCYPGQRWQVYRKHESCEFYVVVQAQSDADELLKPLRRDYPGRVHVRLLEDPALNVTDAIERGWYDSAFPNLAPARNLLMQHWYQQAVWEFYCDTGAQHETIIRQRSDNLFHTYDRPDYPEEPGFDPAATVFAPWWGSYGGINDRFAVMGAAAAQHYFGVYGKIDELLAAGCPFHPETLLLASLEQAGIRHLSTLRAVFSTARPLGHPQYPQRWPVIVPWDWFPGPGR